MSAYPKNVRLQIVTDNVRLPALSQPLPQGEYEAYVGAHFRIAALGGMKALSTSMSFPPQAWFEMPEIRRRRVANGVWVPPRF
jgi:hypothetical protein